MPSRLMVRGMPVQSVGYTAAGAFRSGSPRFRPLRPLIAPHAIHRHNRQNDPAISGSSSPDGPPATPSCLCAPQDDVIAAVSVPDSGSGRISWPVAVNLSLVPDGAGLFATVTARNRAGLRTTRSSARPVIVEHAVPTLGPVRLPDLRPQAMLRVLLPAYNTVACADTSSTRVTLEYALLPVPAAVLAAAVVAPDWQRAHVCRSNGTRAARGVTLMLPAEDLAAGVRHQLLLRAVTEAGLTAQYATDFVLRARLPPIGCVAVHSGRPTAGGGPRWLANGTCVDYGLSGVSGRTGPLEQSLNVTVRQPGAGALWAEVRDDVPVNDAAALRNRLFRICGPGTGQAPLPEGVDLLLCVEVAEVDGPSAELCAAPFRVDTTPPVVHSRLEHVTTDSADAGVPTQKWQASLPLTFDAEYTFEDLSGTRGLHRVCYATCSPVPSAAPPYKRVR